MSDDNLRQEAATSPDLSRQAATSGDSDYSLSIEEALARYEAASIPRTPRSVASGGSVSALRPVIVPQVVAAAAPVASGLGCCGSLDGAAAAELAIGPEKR